MTNNILKYLLQSRRHNCANCDKEIKLKEVTDIALCDKCKDRYLLEGGE